MAICKDCGREYICRSDTIEAYAPDGRCVSSDAEYNGEIKWGCYCPACKCPQCELGTDIAQNATRLDMDRVVFY